MVKKNKTFDSFIFDGELELLEFRLTELDPFVDVFIVAELNTNKSNSVFIKNKKRFSKWKKKISHIFVTEENYYNKITIEFVNYDPDFDDVLMFSEINEIPNLEDKDILFNELKYGTIILKHQNFVWNINHIDKKFVNGTMILPFSSILVNKNFLGENIKKKHDQKSADVQRIINGWKFTKFYYDPKYSKHIEDLLPPETIDPLTTYQLINHKGEIKLPINWKLLPFQEVGRNSVKRHLILVESDESEMMESLENKYHSVSIINFSDDLNEIVGEEISTNTKRYVLYYPNKLLYSQNIQNFENQYKLNEVKRISSTLFLQEQDIVTIIYRNDVIL